MLGLTKRKAAVAVVALLIATIGIHIYVRLSPAYAAAASAYLAGHNSATDVALCLLCPKRISYGMGTWHYRFTLVVDDAGTKHKVSVHSQRPAGTERYTTTFE